MSEIRLPFAITYETEGVTPVSDIIEALKAVDTLTKDAASLFPSLIEGLHVERCSLNVRSLTQESPLREFFFVTLLVTYQDELTKEVPPLIEELFNITVNEDYDTLLTVAVMTLTFYGVAIAVDMAKKTFSDSMPRAKFEELVEVLASETGKPAADIREIIKAKFAEPSAARKIVGAAKRLFLPSQRDRNAPVVFDRDRISSDVIKEIPYPGDADKKNDFDRYTPYDSIKLELHAQDRDRAATGWAAVAQDVCEKRLKVRVMDTVALNELWGKDQVVADIVLVSKLTSDGYVPSEIQVTALHP